MGNRRKGRERRREEGKTEGEQRKNGNSMGKRGQGMEGVKTGQQERERTERGGKD